MEGNVIKSQSKRKCTKIIKERNPQLPKEASGCLVFHSMSFSIIALIILSTVTTCNMSKIHELYDFLFLLTNLNLKFLYILLLLFFLKGMKMVHDLSI